MLTAILEIILAALAVVGLMCICWLFCGRWLLPPGSSANSAFAVVPAAGNGPELEQTVRGLLWLRRRDLWRGTLVILDRGLNEDGLRAARLLCDDADGILLCRPDEIAKLISDT